ncbi:hypothetical protein M758_UG284000 [Ceratodon purpureus]|nr:hypothetical protein M758_UG284000 [Ceratodon purpureus]
MKEAEEAKKHREEKIAAKALKKTAGYSKEEVSTDSGCSWDPMVENDDPDFLKWENVDPVVMSFLWTTEVTTPK